MHPNPYHVTPLIGVTGGDRPKLDHVARLCRDRFDVTVVPNPSHAARAFRYVRAVVLVRSTDSSAHSQALNRALIPAPFVHVWIGRRSGAGMHPPIDCGVPLESAEELLRARLSAVVDTPPTRLLSHAFSRHPDIHSQLKLAFATACEAPRVFTTVSGLAARQCVSARSLRRWWRTVPLCDSLPFRDLLQFVAVLKSLSGERPAEPPPMDPRTYRSVTTRLLGFPGDQLHSLPPAYALQLFLDRYCPGGGA